MGLGVFWNNMGSCFLGICYKVIFIHRYRRLSVFVYLLMGWISIIAIKEMYKNIPIAGIGWLAGGGLLYTFGIIFYGWRKLVFNHFGKGEGSEPAPSNGMDDQAHRPDILIRLYSAAGTSGPRARRGDMAFGRKNGGRIGSLLRLKISAELECSR